MERIAREHGGDWRRPSDRPTEGFKNSWMKAHKDRPVLTSEPTGFWFVPGEKHVKDADGLTEFDRVWAAARELVADNIFIQAAYKSPGPTRPHRTPVVNCYVENYLDVEQVIYSADKLREKVHYPFPLYMKVGYCPKGDRPIYSQKYLQCADGDLYEFYGKGYRIIRSRSAAALQSERKQTFGLSSEDD